MFGPEYTKINTIFKRDTRGIIIPGDWALPEFEYLADNPWSWTEKVNGTNIRLHWNGSEVIIGGRTDDAQLSAVLIANLRPFTDPALWRSIFPEADDVTVYGEGYGGDRIQGGGMYRPDQGFIIFDILIGRWWLNDEDINDIAVKLGLDVVPRIGAYTLNQAWTATAAGTLQSSWPGVQIEGMVGRPAVGLFTRAGERLLVKMKVKDWRDYERRQKPA